MILLLGVAFNGWNGMQESIRLTSAARAGAIVAANDLTSTSSHPAMTQDQALDDATTAINAEEGAPTSTRAPIRGPTTTSASSLHRTSTISGQRDDQHRDDHDLALVGQLRALRRELTCHHPRNCEVRMTSISRAREDSESGVVLIIFALAMVILLGMIAIAIDGGYGFVQNRRAQNAADFAAFAAAQQLNSSTYCSGTASPTTQQIAMIVQKLVDDNGSGIGTAWKAQFLNSKGKVIGTFTASTGPTDPPPGACGVSVSATPKWTPFFAGIFGIHKLQGYASGTVGNVAKGPPIGIVSLNKVGPHAILGGGTGTFIVSGTIFLNTDVTNQPWTELVRR